MATARNKQVEPGHRIVTNASAAAENENATELDGLLDQSRIYQGNMAPLAAAAAESENAAEPDNAGIAEPNETCIVVLKKGSTYRFRGMTFQKDKAYPVEPDVAQKLLKTGMFAGGGATWPEDRG